MSYTVKLNKYYLLKDSLGQYYTDYWDKYWNFNKEEAYKFSSEEEIITILEGEEEDIWLKHRDGHWPYKIITMLEYKEIEKK